MTMVSIHAPVRVRLFNIFIGTSGDNGFNPRTREGATVSSVGQAKFNPVSIHAPVRVRLFNIFIGTSGDNGFNPRTREGATLQHFHRHIW